MGSMGGLCSGQTSAFENELLLHFMPVYYMHHAMLSDQDIDLVKASWNAIINENTCTSYVEKGLELFYKVFFTRVDEIGTNSLAFSDNTELSRQRMLIQLLSIVLRCTKPDQNVVPDIEKFIQ